MKSIALCVLALLGGVSAGVGAQTRAEVPRNGTVAVHSASGSVRVVGWSRAEVSASTDDPDGRVRVARDGGVATVRAADHVEMEVRVPAGSRVVVKTRSGSIAVEGVTGALDLESMSGSFRIGGTPRMVTVEGISGNVDVVGTTETLRVKTVSGHVRVPRAGSFVDAVSVSGDVEVTGGGLRRATLRSTSGRVAFTGTLPRDGSLHLESTSGVVELRVPSGIAAHFDLSSLGSGEVESELGPRPTRDDDSPSVERLRFSNGPGGAEITARTVSGVVRLRRQ
ncbi:MAG TPA: DUF4097 family beta strand repeat-containing protein [Longimicrobiaceae bacterium]|nr:DUF4097 family beta strand repeat-containing protein [Longimicrobiaceae bacterium]